MNTNEESRSPSTSNDVAKYDDGICAICLDPPTNKSNPDCGHVFCFQCLVDWCKIKLECPTCKQRFQTFRHQNLPEYPTYLMQSMSYMMRGTCETWIIQVSDAATIEMEVDPNVSHQQLISDPASRLKFFDYLFRKFNVVGSDNAIDNIRLEPPEFNIFDYASMPY
jgi:E3 ubiquitin-protein ligase Topors